MTDYDLWKTTPPEYPEPQLRETCDDCPYLVAMQDAYECSGKIRYRRKYIGCSVRGIFEEVANYSDETIDVIPDETVEECYIDPADFYPEEW